VVTNLNYEQVGPRDVIVALSDSSIRVSRSRISICGCLLFYNLLILDPVLFFFGKDDLLCLIHLHSNFQLVPPVILAETLDFFYLRKIDYTILPRLG